MSLPLSVLDLIPWSEGVSSGESMRRSLELARRADALGYTRLWYAEHHNLPNILSTTPEIAIALAAQATSRIRLGSGGVMLPNHAPLKVAETYKMLEALFPGRIDLGIGRAPGTDPGAARALGRASGDAFPEKLAELMAFGRNQFPEGHPYRAVSAAPEDVPLPPIYLLGSSGFSAEMAAMLGVGYGFAAHFSDYPAVLPMRAYRDGFAAVAERAKPHAILTLSVICQDTAEEAERQAASFLVAVAQNLTGKKVHLPPPEEAASYQFSWAEQSVVATFKERLIAGTPEVVKARIDAEVAITGADEVMIATTTYGEAARLRSYELLAEAYGLAASG